MNPTLRPVDDDETPEVPVFLMSPEALEATAVLAQLSRNLVYVAAHEEVTVEGKGRRVLVAAFDVDAMPELARLLLMKGERS